MIGICYANFDKLLRGLDKERHSNAQDIHFSFLHKYNYGSLLALLYHWSCIESSNSTLWAKLRKITQHLSLKTVHVEVYIILLFSD